MSEPERREDEGKSGSQGPDSEMFSVPRPRKAIPQIRDVPLTKEEIRRRKLVRMAIAVTLAVLAVTAAFLLYRANHRREIDAARNEAERTGRLAAIDRALGLLEGETHPGDLALSARLHAMAALAGAEGHREPAEALLAQHDPSTDGASDHRIAQAYLALAAGNADEAARVASLLVAGRGPRAAEAGHAIARVQLATGHAAEARAAADAAVSAMPDAPRHRALVIEVAARGGGEAPTDSAGDDTGLRLARARTAMEALAPSTAIRADAEAVHDASDATPAELGWSELALGAADAIDGDTVHAAEHLHAAAEHHPPGDELFALELAEQLFLIGRRLDASATLSPLTSPVTTDASRRALLTARQVLVSGDTEAASRAAETATSSPRRSLVLGAIAELRGNYDLAQQEYDAAGQAPALASYAAFASVHLRLFRRDLEGARAAIASALAESPTHPRLAAAGAYVASASADRDEAFAILGRAESAHPGEPLLLVARARVHAMAAEWEQAYTAFQAAASATDDDPQISSERGQAARMLGHLDEAREAYTAALAVDPRQASALIALLGIQLETHDLVGAELTLSRIDEAHLVASEIDHLRARALVEHQAGQSGVTQIAAAVGRSPDDGELRFALARLYAQAERWSDAADAYYAALSRTEDRRLALGMRAIALARGRRAPTVEAMLDQLRATVSVEQPLTPRDTAMIAVASGWVEWEGDANGRATIFARQALDAVPNDPDATLLLATIDESTHRDPSPRLEAIREQSIEARGWLAARASTPLDAQGCSDARAYLAAAPDGRFAAELAARITACAE
ncbi:MAG: hypothetical protein U0234_15985 [Sandaracinus sp.]